MVAVDIVYLFILGIAILLFFTEITRRSVNPVNKNIVYNSSDKTVVPFKKRKKK